MLKTEPAPLLYLASPIDRRGNIDTTLDRINAIAAAREFGFSVYDPAGAFTVLGEPSFAVARINNVAVDRASALLVIHPELPSVGVWMEVERALSRGIPVGIVDPEDLVQKSWSLHRPGLMSAPSVEKTISALWAELTQRVAEADEPADPWARRGPRLLFQKIDPTLEQGGVCAPIYPGDVGFDLVAAVDMDVRPGEFIDVPHNIRVEFPAGAWGWITGRSSTLRTRGLLVNQGILDCGYRGAVFTGVKNISEHPILVSAGDRLSQLILMADMTAGVQLEEAQELSLSSRGEAGFGSTGT